MPAKHKVEDMNKTALEEDCELYHQLNQFEIS